MVLGLDLAVVGGKLRFYYGEAELIGTEDLIDRLKVMIEDMVARGDQAAAEAEQAKAQAEQAKEALRASVLSLLSARGLPCSDEARAQVSSCDDVPTLQRWLLRATSAGSVEEVLSA